MTPAAEKRLLQATLLLLALSPLSVGLLGALGGPAGLGEGDAVAGDVSSHWRYLSGIFLGLGIMLLSCVRHIEREGRLFGFVCLAVVLGGLARLGGGLLEGWPSSGYRIGLLLELGVTPAVWAWQQRVARRFEVPAGRA
ncbi:DUF4345 domain-containing protein [Sandaracinobacteroides saxicola]|uniref:DUF4345 domain-containing protein n=1 Tax=Sandaracinobacteroides saxicola TaxID=2759707 RepID=A0A7G5IGW0_9SPHN|nr:DUF4345 domain-containing protein [Sandaracinobacteroides saxicola]QMW22602.1 DUF4345 domain-containing protein [Sandaracinobacteroides saxicola]